MCGRNTSPRRAHEGDKSPGIRKRMLTRDVMPILEPRGEVVEEREGVTDRFSEFSEVLLQAAASAGRIAEPFAASRKLQRIGRIVRGPQADARPPYAMPNWLSFRSK